MRVAVLGGRGVSDEPRVSPRERAVLEALLVCRPAEVDAGALAEAVWHGAPPTTWAKQLQASIGRLRKALGTGAIATVAGGYRIVPRREGGVLDVDADDFEAAVNRARELASNGEHQRAVTSLEHAIGMWHGRPYAVLEDWPPARDEADRLRELRASADDDLLEARLAAGDHRAVAEQAVGLCAAEPYRERRWHALALAQYRCERQAEALATVRRAQRLLVDELGIDPGPSLVSLEEAILRHDERLLAAPAARPPSRACPYKGLAEYEPEDAELFFGREDDVDAVLEALDRTRFAAVSGPSGIGKSSILRAGVVPALRRRGLEPVMLDATATASDVALASTSRPLIVDDVGAALADEGRAAALFESLASAHAAGVPVVVALQSRHLDACAAQAAIGPLVTAGLHLVAPPTAAAIRAVVEQPALRSGLAIEHGLVDVILHDSQRVDSALPLLSHALAATWERREGATLTIQAYEATGGLAGAVARSAERVFVNLTSAQRDECRAVMRRLVTVDATGTVALHAADSAAVETTPARAEAVARLVSARLLVARADDYLLAHEALTREWPRLTAWLDEDADIHRLVAHLATAARTWEAGGRNADDLYRGSRLDAARSWQQGSTDALAEVESEFLTASEVQRQREASVVADAAARDARNRRRARILATAGAVAAIAAVSLGGIAIATHRSATRQADDALVQTLADDVTALTGSSREAAALVAVELQRRWPEDPRARAALFDVAAAHPTLLQSVVLEGDAGVGGTIDADGRVVVAAPMGIEVRDPATLEPELSLSHGQSARGDRAVVVSPDGTIAVTLTQSTGCAEVTTCGRLTGFDLADGAVLATAGATVPASRNMPLEVAIESTGTVVATVDQATGSVELRDARSLEIVRSGPALDTDGDAVKVASAADGTFVISATGTLAVLDPATAQTVRSWPVDAKATGLGLAVLPDGRALTSGPNHVALVDLDTGTVEWMVTLPPPQEGACTVMAADPGRKVFYCGGNYGEVQERDLELGGPTSRVFDVQHGATGSLVVRGTELLAFSRRTPTVTRWALDDRGPVHRVIAEPGDIVGDGYRDDSRALLLCRGYTEEQPCTWSVWDIEADRVEATMTVETEGSPSWAGMDSITVYFPDTHEIGRYDFGESRRTLTYPIGPGVDEHFRSGAGDRQLAADPDGTVWAFDLETGEPDGPVIDVVGVASHIDSSPNDRYVVVSSYMSNGRIGAQVFDLRTGEPLSPFVDDLSNAGINDDGLVVAQVGSLIGRFTTELEPIATTEGSRAEIGRFQFSQAGDVFLTADLDQHSTLYDSASGRRVAGPFVSHAPLAWPAWLRRDGMEVAVDEPEGIGIWSLDPAVLLEAACAAAGRDLTQDEWDTHLTALGEWRSTCGFGDEPPAASS